MLVIWPMESCEMWNKSKIILGYAEKKWSRFQCIDIFHYYREKDCVFLLESSFRISQDHPAIWLELSKFLFVPSHLEFPVIMFIS